MNKGHTVGAHPAARLIELPMVGDGGAASDCWFVVRWASEWLRPFAQRFVDEPPARA
ncbi:hypothetical protein MMEU_2845 [Mycobacterium marinum str. Europe]|nr:hypothetical protein MMEU_2845 [Mycobacterium marinum str. Europe]